MGAAAGRSRGPEPVASLDRMRWTFRWKCDGLDAGGLAVSIGALTLTLGGLLRHLTLVEDSMLGERLDSLPFPAHWGEELGLGG